MTGIAVAYGLKLGAREVADQIAGKVGAAYALHHRDHRSTNVFATTVYREFSLMKNHGLVVVCLCSGLLLSTPVAGDSNVKSAIGSAVGGAAGAAVGKSVGGSTGEVVGGAVGGATGAAVTTKGKGKTGAVVGGAIGGAAGAKAGGVGGAALGAGAGGALGRQLGK